MFAQDGLLSVVGREEGRRGSLDCPEMPSVPILLPCTCFRTLGQWALGMWGDLPPLFSIGLPGGLPEAEFIAPQPGSSVGRARTQGPAIPECFPCASHPITVKFTAVLLGALNRPSIQKVLNKYLPN